MSSKINNYFTLHSEHNWENLHIQLKNQQTCTSSNYKNNKGRSDFQYGFCICFSVDMLIQYEFLWW